MRCWSLPPRIRTVLELIEEGALGELSGRRWRGFSPCGAGTERLVRVGNDLANLSLIDRNQLALSFGAADIGGLVEDAAVVVVPIASERKQSLMITVEPQLVHPRVDARHLSKAILNLALNAVRFSPTAAGSRWEPDASTSGSASTFPTPGPTSPMVCRDRPRTRLGTERARHGGGHRNRGGARRLGPCLESAGTGNIFTVDLPFPKRERRRGRGRAKREGGRRKGEKRGKTKKGKQKREKKRKGRRRKKEETRKGKR